MIGIKYIPGWLLSSLPFACQSSMTLGIKAFPWCSHFNSKILSITFCLILWELETCMDRPVSGTLPAADGRRKWKAQGKCVDRNPSCELQSRPLTVGTWCPFFISFSQPVFSGHGSWEMFGIEKVLWANQGRHHSYSDPSGRFLTYTTLWRGRVQKTPIILVKQKYLTTANSFNSSWTCHLIPKRLCVKQVVY